MRRSATTALVCLALAVSAEAAAAPDIAITYTDQFYSQNAFVVSTGSNPNAVLEHRLDGEDVRWDFGSGSPVPYFSVQYPGPDVCPLEEPRLVRIRHQASLDQSLDRVYASLNYECEDIPL